ncbi:hypothetical protein [Rhodococcus sovatensis]|uniref:Uncharacterized protein n=1 Tax=Rhodococcus sovatensis TaxID=1805840 RepID=A0ABZ2PH32_9NOCA
MSEDRREFLRRKYLSLGLGELAAAVVFVVVAFTVAIPRLVGADDQAALWSALVPLSVVLVQGGAYWLSARAWVARASMPTSLATLYRAFRIVDVGLLGAGLVGIVLFLPDSRGATLFVVFIWLFGVIEYVNYFVFRLSYPLRQLPSRLTQWRTPRLVQDLRSAGPWQTGP